MVTYKLLIAITSLTAAFALVMFTAIKLSQPIPQTSEPGEGNIKFTHDLQRMYEASQSALIKLVDNPYLLPYPGVLPNHPFYWTKMVRDRVQLITTSDPTQKMRLLLLFADKRLAAGQLLIATGDEALGISTLTKAEKYLLQAYDIYQHYDTAEKDRYAQYLGDAFNRHIIYTQMAKIQAKPTLKVDSLNQLQEMVQVIYNMQFEKIHTDTETELKIPDASLSGRLR